MKSGNTILNKTLQTPAMDEFSAICTEISSSIRPWLANTDLSKTGIYLATTNAGMSSSVAFWQLALEQEPRFMSPINFPWTLANAPAAAIAMQLHITGPNYTLVGCEEAVAGIIEQALLDLTNQIIENALLIAIDFGERIHDKTHFTLTLVKESDILILYHYMMKLNESSPLKKTSKLLQEWLVAFN